MPPIPGLSQFANPISGNAPKSAFTSALLNVENERFACFDEDEIRFDWADVGPSLADNSCCFALSVQFESKLFKN